MARPRGAGPSTSKAEGGPEHDGLALSLSELLGEVYLPATSIGALRADASPPGRDPDEGDAA